MSLCAITGQLVGPSGKVLSDTKVTILAKQIVGNVSTVSLPAVVQLVSDDQGEITFDLYPGEYVIRWAAAPNNIFTSPLSVPAESSAKLEDLLVEADIPVRGPRGAGWSEGYYDPDDDKIYFISDDYPEMSFSTDALSGPRQAAEAWAESEDSPDGTNSKSSKTWAGEAEGHAIQAAADRIQTGYDRVATGEDRTQTGLDRVATGQDASQTAQDVLTVASHVSDANDAKNDAEAAQGASEEARDKAQEWAESDFPPDGPETKSAKSWAREAELDADQTALDRIQTGEDRIATGDDVEQTGLDVQQTGADVLSARAARDKAEEWAESNQSPGGTGTKSAKTWASEASQSASQAEQDAIQTAQDRIQTGQDRAATGQDAQQTAADRVQTGLDRAATGDDVITVTGLKEDAESALEDAEEARDLSKDWANKDEDSVVAGGEYSSKHYAAKASQSAQDASNDRQAVAQDKNTTSGYVSAVAQHKNDAEEAKDLARDWAEKNTEPEGAGTKSAKSWAGEAEASYQATYSIQQNLLNDISAVAITVSPSSDATATYDPISKTITFELPRGEKGDTGDVSNLATVATTGDYEDLINAPSNLSEFNNDSGYVTTDTTYSLATPSLDGLMSKEDKSSWDSFGVIFDFLENANRTAAVASGQDSLAIGYSSLAQGGSSLAIGRSSLAQQQYTLAIGYQSIATNRGSLAIGKGAESTGNGYGITIGFEAKSTSSNSIAVGHGAIADATNGIAIGYEAEANHSQSIAIGHNSKTRKNYSLAIGTGSNKKFITHVRDPEEPDEAATKNYVDTAVGNIQEFSGDYNDLINLPTFGSAATKDTSDFATAAQGAKADTALQPGAKIPVADVVAGATGPIVVGRRNSTGGLDTIPLEYTPIAETVPRRGAGGIVAVGTPTGPAHATPKSYVDAAIGNLPSPVNADWDASSGLAEIKNKPTIGALAAKDKAVITSDTTGTLPINRGGTGATAVAAARDNLGLTYASTAEAEAGTAANRVMSPHRTTHVIEQKAVQKAGDTGIGGYSAISKNLGNLSGTVTLDRDGGNIQHANNNGPATIAAPTESGVCTIIVEITNTGSAGALTLTGFDDVDGDDLTTNSGDKFLLYVTKTNGSKTAIVKALQ